MATVDSPAKTGDTAPVVTETKKTSSHLAPSQIDEGQKAVRAELKSNFAQNAYVTSSDRGLMIGFQGSDDEGDEDDLSPRSKKKKKAAKKGGAQ